MKRPSTTKSEPDPAPMAVWLLLVHQLPPQPAYLRVKIWRRLQGLGAVSLKNSVYVLPASEQAREDFQWLLAEIERGGGEGVICGGQVLAGMSDQQVRGLFDAARDADYAEFVDDLRKLRAAGATTAPELKSQVAKLRRRLDEIRAIDFFGATGALTAEALLTDVEAQMAEAAPAEPQEARTMKVQSGELQGKVWVTRRGVHVDRIASAWLIRRFVDPEARFKFVTAKDYAGKPGELRFDMFRAEFTHEGDRCTFEVMLERTGLSDPALRAIAEIVHDIDLKDGKFGREQTAGIAHVIAGICMSQEDDLARIDRGSAVLDDTYELFRRNQRRSVPLPARRPGGEWRPASPSRRAGKSAL
jgi:hypothetical protein